VGRACVSDHGEWPDAAMDLWLCWLKNLVGGHTVGVGTGLEESAQRYVDHVGLLPDVIQI